jgi:hypothetical protein
MLIPAVATNIGNEKTFTSQISGSHSYEYEDGCFVGCNADDGSSKHL